MSDSHPSIASPLEFPQSSNRIAWLDHAKGLGIFLVVLGHTLRGLINSGMLEPSMLLQFVDQWLYAFHMPLFFFISGLFIERSVSKSFNTFALGKLQTIVYPYFLWSILQEIIRNLTVNHAEPTDSMWQIIYHPVMQFWFLYILFWISMGYAALRKLKLTANFFVGVCVLLYAAHVLDLDFGGWGVTYMLRMNAIYFAFGVLAEKMNLLSRFSQLIPVYRVNTVVIGSLLMAAAVGLNLSQIRLLMPFLALIGIASTLSLATVLQRFKWANFLNTWGVLSLEIFVAHSICSAGARIFLQKIFHVSAPSIHILLGVAIGIYGQIGLYLICRKINLPYVFTLRSSPLGSPAAIPLKG
jgi:fucose 4-O-acetylase-like acetyltransferase